MCNTYQRHSCRIEAHIDQGNHGAHRECPVNRQNHGEYDHRADDQRDCRYGNHVCEHVQDQLPSVADAVLTFQAKQVVATRQEESGDCGGDKQEAGGGEQTEAGKDSEAPLCTPICDT